MMRPGRKTRFLIRLFFFLLGAPALLMFTTVRCVVVRDHEERIVFLSKVADRDVVIISHTNSMYDARVDEHLEVRGDVMVLTDVVTDSHGVREYYGIADGIPHREWATIRVYGTSSRGFSVTVRGVGVDALGEAPDTHFSIENKMLSLFWLGYWKLHLFV